MSAISTLTFNELIEEMSRRAANGEASKSSLANLRSALKAFLAASGLSEGNVIGSVLRASFYRKLGAHVEQLKAEGRDSRYINNRKTLMGKWASLVSSMDRTEAIATNSLTPFQTALEDLITHARTTAPKLARVINMNKGTLQGWRKGVQPKQTALPALRRIESFFAMEPNALISLAFAKNYYKPADGVPAKKIAYRERLAAQSKDPYYLKTITDGLEREWKDLLIHKTERLPLLKRYCRGAWAITDYITAGKTERNKHCFVNDKYVPTASIVWVSVISYLGWLCRSSELNGAGLAVDEVQTLAWFTQKSMIHRYLAWKIERADDKVHSGILEFIKLVRALTHPDHGYLSQMPALNAHLPEAYRHVSWSIACHEAYAWSSDMHRDLRSNCIEDSREAMEPIKSILELPEPMEAIGDMTARMRSSRPATGGIDEAVWARDLLLIRLMTSNPLRAKNMKLLTYRSDNTGNLYKKCDGSWNIRIDKRAFKNQKSAAGDDDYDVGITKNVWPAIEQYLAVYRPMLPDAERVDFFFLSSKSEKNDGYIGPWQSLNRRVFYLTKRYLWNCPGIGTHGFRYIVGTSILKKNPEAWGLAAAALHDKEETVKAHYAHLRARDKVEHAHSSLAGTYARI